MTGPPVEIRAPVLKAAAWLALLVAGDLWLTHHYGYGVPQLITVGGFATLVSGALPFLKPALSKGDLKDVKSLRQRTFRLLLSTPLVLTAWVLFTIAVLTLSSVTVMSEAGEGVDSVRLAFPDRTGGGKLGSVAQSGALRFHVFTTPFGRPVRLGAPGFVPTLFTLYPLTGLTVWLGRDVPVAPSLLFRPERRGLAALKNGGVFSAWIGGSGRADSVIAEITGVKSSFFVGEPRAIPPEMLDAWRVELACDTAVVRNQLLFEWMRPRFLPRRAASPGPRERVSATIHAANGDLVGRTTVTLGNERLQDVPVPDLSPAPGNCQ